MSNKIPNIGPGANLKGLDLRRVKLRGVNLEGAILEKANLRGVILIGSNLRGANLEGADLTGADLRVTNLREANLREAILERGHLEKAHLERAHLERAHLEKAFLGGAYLEKAHLEGAHLERADLEGTHLEGAHLEGAHLERAHLEGAYLEGAYLEKANLFGAILQNAHLEGAYLQEAYLVKANFQNAHLEGADLRKVELVSANLIRANLTGANLEGAYLQGAYLQEAILERAILERAHLEGAHLEKANLIRANLIGADLSGAKLQEADLERANLSDAILKKAHLEESYLEEANLERADLEEAHLEEATLLFSNLRRANLSVANLRGADLYGAKLQEADLSSADLTEANLYSVDLTEADLTGTILTGVDLTGTILTGVDLEGTRISNTQRAQIAAFSYFSIQQQSNNNLASNSSSILSYYNQSGSGSNSSSVKIINIPYKLFLDKNNFEPLYEKLMIIDLDGLFQFKLENIGDNDLRYSSLLKSLDIDLKNLTKSLFKKLLPIYTNLFFKKDSGGEFILLKENVDMDRLFQHTSQIIKLAKAAHSQIQLRINPEVLEFLSLPNPSKSIANRQNFNKLYANFKDLIKLSGNNVSNFLMNNTLNPQINAVQGNLDAVNRALKAEILFRKTVNGFGFTSWEQYHNMALFIKAFWNISNENNITASNNEQEVKLDLFVLELKFDFESFIKRIKIIREHTREILDINSIPESLYRIYPALKPLLDYILNPNDEANENRKTFVKYVTGTEYSPAEILIKLTNTTMHPRLHTGLPFYGHSCSNTIDLYKAPRNFEGKITQNIINTQLKATTSNKSNLRVAE
jgi:uncharacterized protein YjbI with pentapeptide repeats